MSFNPIDTSLCLAFDSVLNLMFHKPARLETQVEKVCHEHGHSKDFYPIVYLFSSSLQDVVVNGEVTSRQAAMDVLSQKGNSDTFVALEKRRIDYLAATQGTLSRARPDFLGYTGLPQLLKKEALVRNIFASSKKSVTGKEFDYLLSQADKVDQLISDPHYYLPFQLPPTRPILL